MKKFMEKFLLSYQLKLGHKLVGYHLSEKNFLKRARAAILCSIRRQQIFSIDKVLRRLRRVLVCARAGSISEGMPNADLLKTLMENANKVKPIFYGDVEGVALLLFYSDRLGKLANDDVFSDVYSNAQMIADGHVMKCMRCGCAQIEELSPVHRCDNSLKLYECHFCKQHDDDSAIKIYEHRQKYGIKKTVLKMIQKEFKQEAYHEKLQSGNA